LSEASAPRSLLGRPRGKVQHERLGTCREDLLANDPLKWAGACPVDERTLGSLLGEIESPALRVQLLRLMFRPATPA
jgi:hypothetical protein